MRTESQQQDPSPTVLVGKFGLEKASRQSAQERHHIAGQIPELVLNQDSLDAVMDTWKPLPARKYLFRQGEAFTGVFFVRSGSVKSLHTLVSGQEQVTAFYLPGDLIGFEGYQSGVNSTSTLTLETTSVSFVPKKYLLTGKPELSLLDQHLLSKLSEIQNRQIRLSMILSRNKADERIAAFLLDLSNNFASRNFSRIEFRLPMSRTELSSYLGLTVETICRAFQALEKAALVKCSGRDVQIVNLDALAVLAGARVNDEKPSPSQAACG